MIVVDTSVWIALFRNEAGDQVKRLREYEKLHIILIGDIILLECLQGTRDGAHADRTETLLRRFPVVAMLNPDLAVDAARHFRHLRSLGITPRKTADLVIATFCIAHDHRLLHQDRDFEPMVRHIGLQTA